MTGNPKVLKECAVEIALDRFERRISSLHYDGYFTKSFFKEFEKVLGLVAAFRVFFHEIDGKENYNKIHQYHAKPTLIKNENDAKEIKDHHDYLVRNLSADDCSKWFSIDNIAKLYFAAYEEYPLKKKYPGGDAVAIIAVWQCEKTACCLGRCDAEGNTCTQKGDLQSIIVLYGEVGGSFNDFFNEQTWRAKDDSRNWSKFICSIFRKNEEPECFGNFDQCYEIKKDACNWSSRCGAKETKRETGPSNLSKVFFANLDLDVVLQQLRNKFKALLEHCKYLPILIYDPKKRFLFYKSTGDMEYPVWKDWEKTRERAIDNARAVEVNITNELNRLFLPEDKEDKEDKAKAKAAFESICKSLEESVSADQFRTETLGLARSLLELAIQEVDSGLTKDVWENFESFSINPNDLDSIKPEKNLRYFCEHLFFTSQMDNEPTSWEIIITPLGYIGQRIGLIFFLNNKKDNNHKNNFLNIAREFSPLLFHSLQGQVYRDALKSLENKRPEQAVSILCEVLPVAFNITAVAYYPKDEKSKRLIYGFPSADEGSVFQQLEFDFHTPTLAGAVKDIVSDISNQETTVLDNKMYELLPYVNDGEIFTYKDGTSKIRTRSRLLIIINPALSPEKFDDSGVLDIFFDLSEYSLRRNAPDIVREIEFVADLIFEAARQNYKVMQQALRSAVSAIMGRNMSHNIGSHVLARYSSAAGRVGEQRLVRESEWEKIKNLSAEEKEKALSQSAGHEEDHRAVFLRYLQRRMDFVAEVATAERSFWSQPLSLCGVLSALNLDDEKKRVNKDASTSYKPILLSYITGKEGMEATVDASAIQDDPYFACPGGEVGAHALYVILENIIRNSARHNKDKPADDRITIKLKATEGTEEGNKDLWCVTIIDCQSDADNVEKINRIITEERILNQDGSPNPKYWGLREMQICAQYLRALSMSDLEGVAANPLVLKAIPLSDGNGKQCLAYQIYLQRAKLCAVIPAPSTMETVGFSDKESLDSFNKKLKTKGIVIFPSLSDAAQVQGYSFVMAEDTETQPIAAGEGKEAALQFKRNDEIKNIPLLHLPVRTMQVDTDFMKACIEQLKKNTTSNDGEMLDPLLKKLWPEVWLEPLHMRLWQGYLGKRTTWQNTNVKAIVGWDPEYITWNKVKAEHNFLEKNVFCHCSKGNEELKAANSSHKNLLRLFWVNHANEIDFNSNHEPNLLSSARNASDLYEDHIIFAEMMESLSPHKPLLERQKDGGVEGNELVAAAMARVIVLDERVQNEITREYRNVAYQELWPCMGIWVPEVKKRDSSDLASVTDLNHPDFVEIQNFLKNPSRRDDQLPPDFLVLHLTILENLKKQRPEDKCEADTLAALLEGTQVKEGCEVVIVTGRGVPSLSRHNGDITALSARYLPISALLEYLLARPSKLALMRALWSASVALESSQQGGKSCPQQ